LESLKITFDGTSRTIELPKGGQAGSSLKL
jgi:hypothetical protein